MSDHSFPTLWMDVDDILDYLARHSRPSGIQRVAFEIAGALQRLDGGCNRVRFVRRRDGPQDIVTVDWERLAAKFQLVANPRRNAVSSQAVGSARDPIATPLPSGASKLQILTAVLTTEAQVLRALARVAGAIGSQATALVQRLVGSRTAAEPDGTPLRELAMPGDVLVVLGSPWQRRDYVQTARWVRDDLRMRFALLIHDIIPVRRPEWCDPTVVSAFLHWHETTLPLADHVFTNSQATADDVVAWAREMRIALPGAVQPIPMGTGFAHDDDLPGGDLPAFPHLPARGSYALFVSTLEARKNHMLLFRVWRRLLADLPRDRVPTLVFAGRVGWLVVDLMQQLENADWLGGKIRLVRDPSDAELLALYDGCQFTLFPSLFEGWGLPVTESLARGRPCISSNRASLPEAGGDLARYFDPENLEDAYLAVRAVIDDPAHLEAWRERVARDFRHVPWEHSAEVVRGTLNALESNLAC
jgi:glycosyltransferase involved in cell wall biosynthesis